MDRCGVYYPDRIGKCKKPLAKGSNGRGYEGLNAALEEKSQRRTY
jgi:hypothetical protein